MGFPWGNSLCVGGILGVWGAMGKHHTLYSIRPGLHVLGQVEYTSELNYRHHDPALWAGGPMHIRSYQGLNINQTLNRK